jgi:hypothetical protein
MRLSFSAVSLSALLAATVASAADTPTPPRPAFTIVRGVITSVDATTLVVKADDGTTATGTFGPQTPIAAVETRTFDQLKSTDFVGITSSPGKNGHLLAEEIHIIPVHIGEGTYAWDHHPQGAGHAAKRAGSMTNGTLVPAKATTAGSMTNGMLAKGDSAWQLKVSYRGSDMVNGKCVGHAPMTPTGGCVGSSIVDVTPKTVIAAIVPAKATDLKPGLRIVGSTVQTPDGKTVWGNVTTEKNGVKPEF